MDRPVIIALLTTILLIVVTIEVSLLSVAGEPMLSVTPRYTSLSGDLDVTFNLTRLFNAPARINATLRSEAFLLCDGDALTKVQFDLLTTTAVGKFAFKCGSVIYGGFCTVKLIAKLNDNVSEIVTSDRIEIHWPSFKITAPNSLETLTSDVTVSLEATGIACPPITYPHRTWLELTYVRHNESSVTLSTSVTSHRVITDVNEFYKTVSTQFTISCSSFDQAGVYQVRLKTNLKRPQIIAASDVISVRWSEQYSVAFQSGSSAFPCSRLSGVTVFYQHPKCILPGDKIRVYGRMSVAPHAPAASPFVYNYIREKRVEVGRNSVTFPCEMFHRRYVEFCAKYVSMSQHGAVTEVRSACIITQGNVATPVNGGWSKWSPWSSCAGICGEGTETQHRVCDNPSPSRGGRFCEGHPVQSKSCSLPKCPERTTVQSPVGTYPMSSSCRCGCEINVTNAVYVASSGFYCPSPTSSWTFIVAHSSVLRFSFVHFDLNDTVECLQIRNGQLPSSELLLHETGRNLPRPVLTSLPVALLRYHSTPAIKSGDGGRLGMGFVVRVEPIIAALSGVAVASDSVSASDAMLLSPLHLAALVFCVILICFTLSLVAQHIWNVVRKRPNDLSPQSPLTSSPGSFRGGAFYPPFHPVTSTTSISEASVKHQPQIQRRQRKKYGPKSASMDSIASSQVCRSPEDYLRDSKLFQTSLSSLESQLSMEMQEVSHSPSLTKLGHNQPGVHQRQTQPPLLQKQSPLTPGMTRKLPVATVSPQPARVVSPPPTSNRSESEKCTNLDKKRLKAGGLPLSNNFREQNEPSHSAKCKSEAVEPATTTRNQSENFDRRKKKLETVCETSKGGGGGNVHMGEVRMRARQGRRHHHHRPNSSRTLMASLSEFSLSENDEDNFEYDYYDYGMNMQPGSYLTNQYPSWLPPFLPVQPSPYNLEVPMQHFSLSGTLSSGSPGSRPISDASNYQESSADSLMTPVHSSSVRVQSPMSPHSRPIEKSSRADEADKC